MKRKNVYLVVSIGALAATIVVLAVLLAMREYSCIAKFDAGSGQNVMLYKKVWWEGTQPLLYEVTVNKAVVSPKYCFYYRAPDKPLPEFRIILGGDGNMVAIVDSSDPHSLLVLHDFATGWSFPRASSIMSGTYDEQIDRYNKDKETYLAKFRTLRRDNRYALRPG
jgi:hypothetical protein